MAKTNLGRVMPVDKGAYDATVTYSKLDMVHSSDSTYVSKVDNNVGHAVTDTDYWTCYADGKQATTAASNANTKAGLAQDAADAANAAAAACAAYDTRITNLETLTEQLAAEDLSFRDINNNTAVLVDRGGGDVYRLRFFPAADEKARH